MVAYLFSLLTLSEVTMIVSIVLYALFSVLIIGLAVRGFFKGAISGCIGLCRTVISAALAFGAVRLIALIVPAASILSATSALIDSESSVFIAAGASLLGAMLYSAILPFFFGIFFCLFYLVLIVPSRYFTKLIERKLSERKKDVTDTASGASEKPKKTFPYDKIGGTVLRTVDALLIAMLVLMPLSGFVYTLTDGAYAVLESSDKVNLEIPLELKLFGEDLTDKKGNLDFEATEDLIYGKSAPVCDNLYFRLSYSAPFELLYSAIGASKGSNISAGNEMAQTLELCSNLVYLAAPLNEYGDEQVKAIKKVGSYVAESYFHSAVAASLVSDVSTSIIESSDASENELAAAIVMPLLESLAESTPETVSTNVKTVEAVTSELIESGVLKEDGEITDLLGRKDFLEVVIKNVFENENLRESAETMISTAVNSILSQLTKEGDETPEINIDFSSVTSDNIKDEASVLAELISSAYSAANILSESVSFADPATAASIKALGAALDSARNSALLFDATDTIVMTFLKSDALPSSAAGLSAVVEKHLDDDSLSFENIFSSASQLLAIISSSKDESVDSVEVIKNALTELSSSLDPTTAEILKEFSDASPDLFGQVGAEDSDKPTDGEKTLSQKIIDIFITKLSTGEITEDEREREAIALDYALDLIQMKENEGISSVKDIYGSGDGMEEMIRVFIDSELTADIIRTIAYNGDGSLNYDALSIADEFDDDDRSAFLNGSEKVYREKAAEGADMATVRENLIAVGIIFGMDLNVRIDEWSK